MLKSLPPPLKLRCPFLHCVIRRLLPKGFHQVFMNFLVMHFFLTEVLDSCSDFKFLHFANASHPTLLKSVLSKQPSTTACFSHSKCSSIRTNDRLTKILKVSNGAKIRNRYNQVPHLTQDTNKKVTNSQKTPQTRAKRSALSQQMTTKHI